MHLPPMPRLRPRLPPLRPLPCAQVFGFGPDETAFFRLTLFKVPVLDAVVSRQAEGRDAHAHRILAWQRS